MLRRSRMRNSKLNQRVCKMGDCCHLIPMRLILFSLIGSLVAVSTGYHKTCVYGRRF